MKHVKIYYKNKPVIEFDTDLAFQEIIELLYSRYGDFINFEIKNLKVLKKYK